MRVVDEGGGKFRWANHDKGLTHSVSANQNMVAHTELPAQLPHEKIVSSGKDLECRSSDSSSGVTGRREIQVRQAWLILPPHHPVTYVMAGEGRAPPLRYTTYAKQWTLMWLCVDTFKYIAYSHERRLWQFINVISCPRRGQVPNIPEVANGRSRRHYTIDHADCHYWGLFHSSSRWLVSWWNVGQ